MVPNLIWDQVKFTLVNGSFLGINIIGTFMINTSFKPLVLHNILYTPHITKNLVYISQFTKDNQIYFQFHFTHCVVHNSHTNQVLLQGSECEGLYKLHFSLFSDNVLSKSVRYSACIPNPIVIELPTPHISCSLNQLKVSFVFLHHRLGDSSSQTLSLIIKNNNMCVSATIPACVACVVGKNM